MRLHRFLLLAAGAHAYTPPKRSPRSPAGGGPKRRPRERVTEPLESWGAFDPGPHRLGAATWSWGDTRCGWRKTWKKKQKKENAERFSNKDTQRAYSELAEGGVGCWSVAANTEALDIFAAAVEAVPTYDPPKLVVHCAPSLRARLFGKGGSRTGYASVNAAVNDATDLLGSAYVDLLLVGPASPEAAAAGAAKHAGALRALGGRVDAVGCANVKSGAALRKAHRAFERQGLRLAACSVDFSLIDAGALRDGTLEAAKELDITVLAKSPLYQGLGSGEITARNPTGGAKFGVTPKWRFRALSELAPLHDALEQVSQMVEARRSGVEREAAKAAGQPPPPTTKVLPAQVALQWTKAKGAVPFPAVKNRAHAKTLLATKGWALTAEEVEVLDAALPRAPPKWPRLR